jgi:alpha-beta hydrolase superfamily lysophospholipase
MPSSTDVSRTSSCLSSDGLELKLLQWPCESARGQVLIVHGLGEHAARHAWLAEQLQRAGWQVSAWDHRGHGSSPGPRGDIPYPDALLDDLARVVDHVRPSADRRPLVLFGHSLGGLVAARFVAEGLSQRPAAWHRAVDRLVLSSPALDPGLHALQRLLLAVAGRLAPHLAVSNGLRPAWISRDAQVVEAYRRDPLVHDRVTSCLAQFIVDAAAHVRAAASQWVVPTLLQWAGADRCVAPPGSAAFAAAAPACVQSRCYAELFHEIYNEPERAQVLADLLDWLRGPAGAA